MTSIKGSGYVFSGKYKAKAYKPDHMRGYKYVLATLAFSLSLWMLLYILGVRM